MKKLFLFLILLLTPFFVWAQDFDYMIDDNEGTTDVVDNASSSQAVEVESNSSGIENFEAKVISVLGQREIKRPDGVSVLQQDVKLIGLTGRWKDKEMVYKGIGEIDVIARQVYAVGDKVEVMYSPDAEGNDVFYITDFVRHDKIWWLLIFFTIAIIIVARWKGVMSLVSLISTFLIILYFIIPKILSGSSPLFITIIGSLLILPVIIYFTEGFKRSAHLAVISILFSLIITGILSIIFTSITKLSGVASEEIMYLIGAGKGSMNFSGLLLAGIIIGTLGVLDDVVISQISAVEELKIANPTLSSKELYKRAMKIGIAHIGSMTNTLFLAYAGASLPLLLVFSLKQEPFLTLTQILDDEMVATEIARTLVGSIGLALSVPIATILAAKYLKNDKDILARNR
jgi:uncharacterized membrane protein